MDSIKCDNLFQSDMFDGCGVIPGFFFSVQLVNYASCLAWATLLWAKRFIKICQPLFFTWDKNTNELEQLIKVNVSYSLCYRGINNSLFEKL